MYEYVKSQALAKRDSDAWLNYSRWNELIASHFFSDKYENRPVYLDISDQLLVVFGEKSGLSAAEAIKDFRDSIIGSLSSTTIFNPHLVNAFRWKRRTEEETPPFVALLAFFSYVAEKMVRDNDFGANNYYGRLQRELGLSDEHHSDLQKSYREIGELIWPWLNEWIASWDGEIGLPTAKALDSRIYVSVAISQALVREQDRNALKRIFIENGLNPGQRLGKMEMLSLLLHWSSSAGGSSSLSKMIQRGGDIRDKVSEIACSELEAWDGKLSAKEIIDHASRIFYIATHKKYPQNKLSLYLSTNDIQNSDDKYEIATGSSVEASEAFKDCANEISFDYLDDFGVSVIEPFEKISNGDALLAKLRIKNKANERILERNGQPLCVLIHRLEIGAFQEVSRVVIGTPAILLVHQSILEKVTGALNEIARPGFKVFNSSQTKGLPEGWLMIADVQILKSMEIRELEALSPLLGGSVSLIGGLYLGNDTWLCSLPPEVVISLDTDKTVTVEIIQSLDFGNKFETHKFATATGVQFIDLNSLQLPDGDYQVVIYEGAPPKRVQSTNFKIRSGSSVRMYKRSSSAKLSYVLASTDSLGSISATKDFKKYDSLNSLNGCYISSVRDLDETFPKMEIQLNQGVVSSIAEPDLYERTANTKTVTLEAGSCVLRGYHIKVYDPIPIGAPVGYLVRAKCSDCSLTVWEPTRGYYSSGSRRGEYQDKNIRSSDLVNAINVRSLPPIAPSGKISGPTYRQIFDALCYLKEGSFERLSTIVRSKYDEPWAPYETLRKLVGLGHIDVELDLHTLRPQAWRVADPSLVLTGEKKFTVVGWSSETFISQLQEVSASLGGMLRVIEGNYSFPVIEIDGIDSENIDDFAEIVSAVSAFPISCTKRFTHKLLSALPTLSEIAVQLPKVEMPENNLQFFDPEDMKWKAADIEIKAGAYRHDLNGIKYFYLPQDFLRSSTAVLCDARLAKYFSLSKRYWKFFKYDEGTRILKVPIGMELPFIFDRVAISCSGKSPENKGNLIEYTQISKEIAEGLAYKLFNQTI